MRKRRKSPAASAAAVYELQLANEKGVIAPTAEKMVDALAAEIGLAICNLPFWAVVQASFRESWTRDPMDRLIVANANAAGAPLVTADRNILQHYSRNLVRSSRLRRVGQA